MRVNNDLLCDLAALIEYDDTSLQQQPQPGTASSGDSPAGGAAAGGAAAGGGELKGRFLRYAFVPGLGVGHPAIQYDEVGGRRAGVRAGGYVALRGSEGLLLDCGAVSRPIHPAPPSPPLPAYACLFHYSHAYAYCCIAVPPQVSDLYWMASNVNRDANRRWKQPKQTSGINPELHITAFRWGGSVEDEW